MAFKNIEITELDMLLQLKYEKHGQIVRMERSFLTHKKKAKQKNIPEVRQADKQINRQLDRQKKK